MEIRVYGFHSVTDYYTFVNTLYPSISYTTIGEKVIIKNPPDKIFELIKYFEAKYENMRV